MNTHTEIQFKEVVSRCKKLFEAKNSDYGPAWRILRPSSLTDQIYIKANRIRTLQTKGQQLVDEGIEPEFMGIVNYAAMAIIQLRLGVVDQPELTPSETLRMFGGVLDESCDLMMRKNHDYDEAWRNMRISSLTDIILMKLLRVKQIEDNQGTTLVSEGIDASYFDMINYAVFALILIHEKKDQL
jgi:hypothetical protein